MERETKFKVAEAVQDDVGKGIIRIDGKSMRDISVKSGEIVEITGEKRTVAIVNRAYPADVGLGIIRMDGNLRKNARTGIGETVKIKKADWKEAKKVHIAPLQKGIKIVVDGAVKKSLLGRPVLQGDIISLGGTKSRRRSFTGSPFEDMFRIFEEDLFGLPLSMAGLKWLVVNTNPKDNPVLITDVTDISVSEEAVELKERKVPEVSYEDVGGLDEAINKIREMVELPLKHPELFERLGVEPPKGVLLHGPPGCGKTLLAKAVANESDAYFISVSGPEFMSKFYGQSEANLRKVFDDAEKNAPAILFIDEVDAIAPKRDKVTGEVERRVVAQLLAKMDGLKGRGQVIVIAATNRPDAIDEALRRPGRFDREVDIGVPDREGRLEILKIHTRHMPLAKDVGLEMFADITYGYVGADLASLCKEAAMHTLRRVSPELKIKEDEILSKDELEKLRVTNEDFREALKLVRPSAMREVRIEIPKTKWEDIGGLKGIKQQLKEAVEWPLTDSESFKRMGIRPPKGILLYGPPGCGKTLLARGVATESKANFITVKGGAEIYSMWVGESEKAIRKIFKRARQVSPSIIFLDELDAIIPKRGLEIGSKASEKVVNQLLTEIDGLEDLNNVVLIGATNRPDIVDSALLRPGRFDRLIFVPPPGLEARKVIFKIHTKKMPLKGVNLDAMARKTEGYSGADIANLCREAGMIALREDKKAKHITTKHFENALKAVTQSITKEQIKIYQSFEDRIKVIARPTKPENLGYVG